MPDKKLPDTKGTPADAPVGIPPELLEQLPKETRMAYIEAESFRGPLPPPSLFEQYGKVLENAPERIMHMTELEQEQRHTWDSEAINCRNKEIARGQWLGFALAALAIFGAVFCAYINQAWVATVLGGASLAAILAAYATDKSNKE